MTIADSVLSSRTHVFQYIVHPRTGIPQEAEMVQQAGSWGPWIVGVRCECVRERMFCNYCAQCISRTDRVQPPTLHPAFPEPRTGKYQRTRPTVCHNLYLFSKVKGINYIFDLDLPGGVSHFLSDVWRGEAFREARIVISMALEQRGHRRPKKWKSGGGEKRRENTRPWACLQGAASLSRIIFTSTESAEGYWNVTVLFFLRKAVFNDKNI